MAFALTVEQLSAHIADLRLRAEYVHKELMTTQATMLSPPLEGMSLVDWVHALSERAGLLAGIQLSVQRELDQCEQYLHDAMVEELAREELGSETPEQEFKLHTNWRSPERRSARKQPCPKRRSPTVTLMLGEGSPKRARQ